MNFSNGPRTFNPEHTETQIATPPPTIYERMYHEVCSLLQDCVEKSLHMHSKSRLISTNVSNSPQYNFAYQNHSPCSIYSKYSFFCPRIYHTVCSTCTSAIFWKIEICLGYYNVVRARSTKMFCICQMPP